MRLLFVILSLSVATQVKRKSNLPSCGGCFAIVNGVYYACCNGMSINNNVCTCNGNQPCTQCSPSPKDKEKVLPVTPSKKPAPLPSCNGCFSSVNGVYYACCDSMSINNGDCTCDGNEPCTQCSPSPNDKEKVFVNKTNGVGPCGGLLTLNGSPSGNGVYDSSAGLCMNGNSQISALSFYDANSGTYNPVSNVTLWNGYGTYFYMQTSWSGISWLNRQVGVCFCSEYTCSNGPALCNNPTGPGGGWTLPQFASISFPHVTIAVQTFAYGYFS